MKITEFNRDKVLWTLVQHSGFGYGGREEMQDFVEARVVMSQKELDKINKANGFVLDKFEDIEKAEIKFGFDVKGTFANSKIDGLRILKEQQ